MLVELLLASGIWNLAAKQLKMIGKRILAIFTDAALLEHKRRKPCLEVFTIMPTASNNKGRLVIASGCFLGIARWV